MEPQMETQGKKRKKKKWWLTVVALVIVLAGGAFFVAGNVKIKANASTAVSVKVMPLRKGNLAEQVSVSGTLHSANTQNVYSTQNYPIKQVNVAVGDTVKAGDILAVLDMSSVNYDIEQSQNNIKSAEITASEDAKTQSNNVQNAQATVNSAKLDLEKAQSNYDTLKKNIDSQNSTELINAQNSIDSAKAAVDSAENTLSQKTDDYNTNKALYEGGAVAKSTLDTAERAMNDARDALSTAKDNYQKALDAYEREKDTLSASLADALNALQSAQLSAQNAQNALKQAQSKSSTAGISLENQKISLDKLQQTLGEDKIIAPIDGTVTEVDATVGANPSGVLFVIEDMEHLYVSANVKEYDLVNISSGQDAYVTTDVTGNDILKGKVDFISPKAVSESTSTTVEYETHTALTDSSSLLRIGMTAYLNIVTAAKSDVYAVSYSALNSLPGGKSSVYAVEDNTVVEIPVETGMETSTSVEITGDGLKDGLSIIANPTAVTVGQKLDKSMIQSGAHSYRNGNLPGATGAPGGQRDAQPGAYRTNRTGTSGGGNAGNAGNASGGQFFTNGGSGGGPAGQGTDKGR